MDVFRQGYLSLPVYIPVPNQNPLAPPPPYAAVVGQRNPFVAGPPGFPANPPPHPGWGPGGPLALPAARPAAPAAPAPPAAPAAPAAAAPAGGDYPPGTHIDGNRAGLPRGVNYLYPKKHTTIRVVKGNFDPLSSPRQEFDFWAYKVPTILTVSDLIHQLGAQAGGNDKCGVTELLEVGDGTWSKGVTIFQKDDQKKQTLAAMGWDEARGTTKPVVWLKLHKG
ncbi:MAG: hypothetical protein M1839_000156 [Geoglossum umbratile]|nr:MAG: hypothetical protein M1839_000156 [Geoglossum umbratile]